MPTPLTSRGNVLMRSQATPAQMNALASARRMNAFEKAADRRYAEMQQYGRELGGLERFTTTLPRSDSPADVQSTLAAVAGSQFGSGMAATALANPGRAVRSVINPLSPQGVIPMTTYHGSPHRINNITPDAPMGRFDLSKVGTGEGAQAYGHGIYLAENPEVAKQYQRNLSGVKTRTTQTPTGSSRDTLLFDNSGAEVPLRTDRQRFVKRLLQESRNDYKKAAEAADLSGVSDKEYKAAVKMLKDWEKRGMHLESSGNFYTVDLPDEHIANMLDWDAPLSKQPEAVREALRGMDSELFDRMAEGEKHNPLWGENFSGGAFYKALAGDSDGPRQAAASAKLNKLGIPGIKYLDAGSRAGGEGTRNFVIFSGDTAKILKRE